MPIIIIYVTNKEKKNKSNIASFFFPEKKKTRNLLVLINQLLNLMKNSVSLVAFGTIMTLLFILTPIANQINQLNGTSDLGTSYSEKLLVNLQSNHIYAYTDSGGAPSVDIMQSSLFLYSRIFFSFFVLVNSFLKNSMNNNFVKVKAPYVP